MSLFQNVIQNIENRKRRMESGRWNAIPCPFSKFAQYYGGIEKGKYEMVTANKKAGKCFGAGTQVLMYDGSIKAVETVKDGEVVMGPDKLPRQVSGVASGREKMFTIVKADETTVTVNESHILYLEDVLNRIPITISVKDWNTLVPTEIKPFYMWCNIDFGFYDFTHSTGYRVKHQSFTIKESVVDNYYGFTVDKDHLFLLADFSVVHNTQYTDFAYVYHPIRFCESSGSDLDVRIKYLSLEMTKEQKMMQAMCHFLYFDSQGQIRVSPQDLRSAGKPLDQEVLDAIIRYEPFFVKYLDRVDYRDDIRSIDEIIAYVKQVCLASDIKGEQITEVILDHISLVIPRRQQTKKQAIDEISSSLFVGARNNFRINPIVVQQQANEKESFEAKKMNDLLPSFGGLSDSKDTARDIDMCFGVFSPEAAKMQMYGTINVPKLGDGLRIINIVGGRESAGQKELAVKFDGAVSFFEEM